MATPDAARVASLQQKLENVSLEFGISSYMEGAGIRPTLDSLREAIAALGFERLRLIVSDSSPTDDTARTVDAWAAETGSDVALDQSRQRRSTKEADNVILEKATADLLVMVDADVIVPASGLLHLLDAVTQPPTPRVAIGMALPDPDFRQLRYRASAWQMKATARLTSWLPKDRPRAEGAFWVTWRSFYATFRFPVGSGSRSDDVSLANHLLSERIPARTEPQAIIYKVPAGTLADLYLQTHRGYASAGGPPVRTGLHVAAAALESVLDPVGSAAYAYARLWSARESRRRRDEFTERYDPAQSTKR